MASSGAENPALIREGVTQPAHNPRRTPPHLSKSLPQHKKRKLGHGQSNQNDDIEAAGARIPVEPTQSSGSGDSASKWFDKSNKNITTGQDGSPQSSGWYIRQSCDPWSTDIPPR
jgi:hypothetical protein